MESEITCPKCNGCGKIKAPRIRNKRVISSDPDKRYCMACKVFKHNNDYYRSKGQLTSYCKKCHCSKKKKTHNKETRNRYARKHDCFCKVCGMFFKGYTKQQYSCSRKCHMTRLNKSLLDESILSESLLNKLPNELADQLREEGYK